MPHITSTVHVCTEIIFVHLQSIINQKNGALYSLVIPICRIYLWNMNNHAVQHCSTSYPNIMFTACLSKPPLMWIDSLANSLSVCMFEHAGSVSKTNAVYNSWFGEWCFSFSLPAEVPLYTQYCLQISFFSWCLIKKETPGTGG